MSDETNQPQDRFREVKLNLTEDAFENLRSFQDFNFAIVGGLVASLLCAIIWAFVTVRTEFQIGYMAVGVGFVVSMAVRFFGAGVDVKFAYLGMILSLLGCVLGNLFSQIGFIAEAYNQSYLETLSFLSFADIKDILLESFHPMDVLFYGIAIYMGYKYSLRPIPNFVSEADDLTPPFAKFRLPLTVISLVVIAFVVYSVSQSSSGFKTYYYESGAKMSEGEMINGQPEGNWQYWYENGVSKLTGNYINGLEDGLWQWFNQDGSIIQKSFYLQGLQHGTWIEYYNENVVMDSGSYKYGRQEGPWVYFGKDGKKEVEGNFFRDHKSGNWKLFHTDGKLAASGDYAEDMKNGMWQYWDTSGNLNKEIKFLNDEISKIHFAVNPKGKVIVKNGNGIFEGYSDEDILETTGEVRNGKKIGLWKTFYPDGSVCEEIEFLEDTPLIKNRWDVNGSQQISNGEGRYVSYHPGTKFVFETGSYSEGKRSGFWKSYYQESKSIMGETFYDKGKKSGVVKGYYESEILFSEGEFAGDKQSGEWKWYYPNGSLQSDVQFTKNGKEGVQSFYSEDGRKLKEEYYKSGKFINEKLLVPES